jgi:AsmA protein
MPNAPKPASQAMKIFTVAIATIVLFFLASIILLISMLNTQSFKNELSTLVQKATHREFAIAGDMKLSFFPWMGVRVKQITLGNAPGFANQDFAQVGEADIRIRVLPLFIGKVDMGAITLKDATIHLTKNKDGQNNWSDLVGNNKNDASNNENKKNAATVAQLKHATDKIPELTITSIDINNGTITWDDQQSGQQAIIKQVNFSSKEVELNHSFPIDLNFNLQSNKPNLNIYTNLHSDILFDPKKQQFSLHDASIESDLFGNQYPNGKAHFALNTNLSVDLNLQTLQAKDITAQLENLKIQGNIDGKSILQSPTFTGQITIPNFSPRTLLTDLGQKVNLQDNTALQNASLQANAEFSPKFIKLDQIQATLDDATLNGQISVANFAKKSFDFDLKLNKLNLDRYLTSNKTKQTTVMGANNSWHAYAAANNTALPTDFLRDINGQGILQVDQLTIAKINLKKVYSRVFAEHGVIKITPLSADLYEGRSQGAITLNASQSVPTISVNEMFNDVQVGQLLSDLSNTSKLQITGTGNLTLNLKTQGNTADALIKALDGNIRFGISNGTIKNLNVAQQMYAAIAHVLNGSTNTTSNTASSSDETKFVSLTGNILINNGIATNNDLLLQSTALRATGKGTANLVSQTIDYNLDATALGDPFGRDVLNVQEQIGGSIPLHVTGSFADPKINPNLTMITANLLKGRARQEIEKHFGPQLNDVLNNKNVQNFLNKL